MTRVRFYTYRIEAEGRTPDIKQGTSLHWLAAEGRSWKVAVRVQARNKAEAERTFRRTHKAYRRCCRQTKVKPLQYAVAVTKIKKADLL